MSERVNSYKGVLSLYMVEWMIAASVCSLLLLVCGVVTSGAISDPVAYDASLVSGVPDP